VRTRDWAEIDFYAVLGVDPTAPVADIAVAFRGLAKQLHPDRGDSTVEDAERFTTVVSAYEVLGDKRLRRAYDDVRAQRRLDRRPAGAPATAAPVPSAPPSAATRVEAAPPVDPVVVRRHAHRWITGGVAVLLAGIVVAVVIVRLQAHDRARRAGREHADAVIVAVAGHTDVRFSTAAGATIQVAEPNRINPGTDAAGSRLGILYRPDHPSDVIADESTTARDITLWIVAVKLLIGGTVFLVVGVRRLRRLGSDRPATVA
jgi:hypothetical protein